MNKKIELSFIFLYFVFSINIFLDIKSKRGTEKEEGC